MEMVFSWVRGGFSLFKANVVSFNLLALVDDDDGHLSGSGENVVVV